MPERTCIAQIAERVRRKCTLFGSIGAHRLSTCKYLSHGQQTNEPEIREPSWRSIQLGRPRGGASNLVAFATKCCSHAACATLQRLF